MAKGQQELRRNWVASRTLKIECQRQRCTINRESLNDFVGGALEDEVQEEEVGNPRGRDSGVSAHS